MANDVLDQDQEELTNEDSGFINKSDPDPTSPFNPQLQNIINPFLDNDSTTEGDDENKGDSARGLDDLQKIFKRGSSVVGGQGAGAEAATGSAVGAESAIGGLAAGESAIGGVAGTSAISGGAAGASAIGAAPAAGVAATSIAPVTLAAIIAGIVIGILLYFVFFSGGGGSTLPSDQNQSPAINNTGKGGPEQTIQAIPGLTITLTGPNTIDNGQSLTYTVGVTYDSSVATTPLDQIVVYDNIPSGATFGDTSGTYHFTDDKQTIVAWPLSEDNNKNGFTFTLTPSQSDFVLSNTVYATAADTSSTSSTPGGPVTGGYCSVGSGVCSPQNLLQYFGDQVNAQKASIICNRESGGNYAAVNTNCGTNDYSVGLFQINLVAHCPGAYGSGSWGTQSCDNLLSIEKRNACEAKFKDPVENIKYAAQLQKQLGWQPWTTSAACRVN